MVRLKLEIEPSADMATSYFRRALAKLADFVRSEHCEAASFGNAREPAVVEWLRDHATDGNAASGSGSTA